MAQEKEPLLRVDNLYTRFNLSGGFLDQLKFSKGRLTREKIQVKAVNGVSFSVFPSEILCLVGESGCGKSSIGRTIMGLSRPHRGEIYYRGIRIDNLTQDQMRPFRKQMQMIFQDPYASLNPRMNIQQTLLEPIKFHYPELTKRASLEKVVGVIRSVGVDPGWGRRYPHELSGGQRQRISIARALIVDPEFIVADEPISALDVSIQAQILNLLRDTQEERHLSYLFITHDLSVVEHIANRVIVMYLGVICEQSSAKKLFEAPRHPYTQALLSAVPRLGEKRKSSIRLKGEVPTPLDLPTGCFFHQRCQYANDRCKQEFPRLRNLGEGVQVACHAVEEDRL